MKKFVKESLLEGEKTHEITKLFGDIILTFKIHYYDGEALDTAVMLGDKIICWISFKDKDEFMGELQSTISKYRI